LPTRKVSAATGLGTRVEPLAASNSTAAIRERNGAFIGMLVSRFGLIHNPPLIPAHSASVRAFTPVFDGLWTRVNALMLGIQSFALGPRFRGDERTWAVINLIRTISF
jgi:hypothetical protein